MKHFIKSPPYGGGYENFLSADERGVTEVTRARLGFPEDVRDIAKMQGLTPPKITRCETWEEYETHKKGLHHGKH